uniref:hypothetical protein n=1 Tax=Nocardia abscessus TaxID=120957 RepID=UPI001E5E78E1
YCSRTSATMRTALSRSSGGYFFELTDFILPHQMKSPDPPGRFIVPASLVAGYRSYHRTSTLVLQSD